MSMVENILILGWGSLIRGPDELKTVGDWSFKTRAQRLDMIRKAAAAIAKLALQLGVPIAAEKLDFGRTPDQVRSDGDPGLDPATPGRLHSRCRWRIPHGNPTSRIEQAFRSPLGPPTRQSP